MARIRPPPPANPSRHCRSRKARKAHATLAPISRNAIANRITFSNGRNFPNRNIKQDCSRKTLNTQRAIYNTQSSSIQNRDRRSDSIMTMSMKGRIPGLPPVHSCLMSPAFTGYASSSCLRYPSVRGAFIAYLRRHRTGLCLFAHYRHFEITDWQ